MTTQWRGIGWFLLIAFGISWALWGSIWLAGIPLKSGAGVALMALDMWGPGLSALIVARWVFHQSWRATTRVPVKHACTTAAAPQ